MTLSKPGGGKKRRKVTTEWNPSAEALLAALSVWYYPIGDDTYSLKRRLQMKAAILAAWRHDHATERSVNHA